MTYLTYIENIRLPTEKAHGYQIMKTCEALVATGAQVSLLVADRQNPIQERDVFVYYGLPKTFSISRLPVIDVLQSVPSFLWTPAFVWERWQFGRRVERAAASLTEGVIYTRDAYIAERCTTICSRPVFLELHALRSPRRLRGLRAVSGIICMTNWLAQEVSRVLPHVPVTVIPDAVDLHVFDPSLSRDEARQALGISRDARVVVYGGRFSTMEEGKGLGVLDAAVESLAKQNEGHCLFLIGGDVAEFQRIEKRLPSARTTCISAVPRATLALYYRAADILVMPFPNTPHYAYEMSPLKMFEYMASRTPIVTSDLPSVRDVLDESTCFFYDPDAADGLRGALRRALSCSTDELVRVATRARERAEGYSWDARARAILEFCSRVTS